ncbi:MAG TPA: hypothetical protein VJ803_03945 [Gemmatimonadaceae bacterium]|nr:hypothetical protein [Gemmatimonadaceae bacterium]
MQRSKNVAIMFLLGTLLVGGVLGFTADRVIGRSKSCDRVSLRADLAGRLGLSEQQRAAVDSILDNRHQVMSAAMATIRPKMDSIRQHARNEIARVLDDRQRALFEQMVRESEAKRQQKREGEK